MDDTNIDAYFKIGVVQFGTQLGTKIAIPITGKTIGDVQVQAQAILKSAADMAEWRLDYLNEDVPEQAILKTAKTLKQQLRDAHKCLLMTIRTAGQGGHFTDSSKVYLDRYQFVIDQNLTDAIDVEYTTEKDTRRQILKTAALADVPVILSYHDFRFTPTLTEMQQLLAKMDRLDVDLLKIAVMPKTAEDVLHIFEIANWGAKQLSVPLIIMGMGKLGRITRVSGNVFPSALTFATLNAASAPGQMPLEQVQQDLQTFHV